MRKTPEELAYLTPAELKAYEREQANIVFGPGHKVVKGKPVEGGIGAPGRETENHFQAIRKWEGPEAEKAARDAAKQNRKTKAA